MGLMRGIYRVARPVCQALCGILFWAVLATAQTPTASLLPNGEQQYVDGNGAPYADGTVCMYIPSTLTAKQTWSDPLEANPNTSPCVTLDSQGRAIIYGSGTYRQILKDQNGNTIWDQLTQDVIALVPITSLTGGTGITVTNTGGAYVVSLSNTAVTAGTCTLCTITVNAQGQATSIATGTVPPTQSRGFVNILRNASLTSWFHGCTGSACTITTSGGWCAEGVWVIPTGASVTCQRTTALGASGAYYGMIITGANSVTDVSLRFPVESYTAAVLGTSRMATFQMSWTNATGGSVTPTLATKAAGTQDSWGAPVSDLSPTSMAACPNTTICTSAYTFTVATNAYLGYEFVVDLGNNFTSNASAATIYLFDARYNPGATTGITASPPVAEQRDASSDINWNRRFYQASYDNGVAPGASTHTGIVGGATAPTPGAGGIYILFPVQMRVAPTVAYWDGAGNASKLSTLAEGGNTWTDNDAVAGGYLFDIGTQGFVITLYASATSSNFIQYTADSTISGG